MEPPKNRGLTVSQINKAIFGETKPKPSNIVQLKPLIPVKKRNKLYRKVQNYDAKLLLDLTYSTGQICTQLPTPEWFSFKERPDVSIICPLYMNTLDDLVDSWDFDNEGMRVEFIFVDDNCPWNSGKKVFDSWKHRQNEVTKGIGRVFVSAATQGYGACCNFGAEKANGKILVFLHPESKLFPGWLSSLTKIVRLSEVGAVGGLHIFEEQDTVLEAGLEWSWEEGRFLKIGSEVFKNKKLNQPFQMNNVPLDIFQAGDRQAVSSNFMAVKKENFLETGGFSPTIFHQTWSDADFCCSLREKGLKIVYQQSARAYHKPFVPVDKYQKHGEIAFFNKWVNSGRIDSLVDDRLEAVSEIKNILIRRQFAHGDVLVAAAIAPALKKKYPNAKIIFATDCIEVVQGNPWIDCVVSDYSERQFNIFINLDMIYEYRPKTNFLTAYAEEAGVPLKDCKLFIQTEPFETELPEKYVVMHAGKNFWAGREWSTIKFDQISNRLRSEGHKIVCVGTLSDHKPVSADIDLRGKTSVGQLASVIQKSSFFVGIDSFPMFIAETFNIKGVAFFGSILPETRLITKNITPVYADGLKCLGCHHRKALPCISTTTCEIGVQECVIGVSVDRMWQNIKKQFN